MKRIFPLLAWLLPLLCIPHFSTAQQGPFVPGDAMPIMELTVPALPDHRDYLGIRSDTDTFKLTDIQAEALLLQVFSMYCPICQKEAPKVNDLFDLVAAQGLENRIKILGLGAGNSDLEVQVFRDKYGVLFPLFSDPDYVLHKQFSGVGTPYFVLVRRTGGNDESSLQVRLSHLGSFDDEKTFLARLLSAMNMEAP